tara:strand:+ start:1575 stop:2306 length:732 start_codon:yes stop_codon:yes gene_type:complete
VQKTQKKTTTKQKGEKKWPFAFTILWCRIILDVGKKGERVLPRRSTLRDFLKDIDLDGQITIWARKSKLEQEDLKEHALQIIVKMLEKELDEDDYVDIFPDQISFLNYWYVATVRSIYSSFRQEKNQRNILHEKVKPIERSSSLPEDKYFASEWLYKALERELRGNVSDEVYQDCVTLVELVLQSPQRYIQQRASGKDKGKFTFHFVELSRALSWTRVRLYKRCDQIKEALFTSNEEDKINHG